MYKKNPREIGQEGMGDLAEKPYLSRPSNKRVGLYLTAASILLALGLGAVAKCDRIATNYFREHVFPSKPGITVKVAPNETSRSPRVTIEDAEGNSADCNEGETMQDCIDRLVEPK